MKEIPGTGEKAFILPSASHNFPPLPRCVGTAPPLFNLWVFPSFRISFSLARSLSRKLPVASLSQGKKPSSVLPLGHPWSLLGLRWSEMSELTSLELVRDGPRNVSLPCCWESWSFEEIALHPQAIATRGLPEETEAQSWNGSPGSLRQCGGKSSLMP